MASAARTSHTNHVCSVCAGVVWFQLPPEDGPAILHHKSRTVLEASAEKCLLCRMVLHAAISNHRDSRGSRYGKGYWRKYDKVKLLDETGLQDVTIIQDLGCYPPLSGSEFNSGSRPMMLLPPVFGKPDFMKNSPLAVIAPTVEINADKCTTHVKGPLAELSVMDLGSSENLPVWLYGNWWAVSEPKDASDSSHLRLVGIGARFGSSPGPMQAFGSQPGEISIRGSSIGVCVGNESPLSTHISGRLREVQSNSDIAFRRLSAWLEECRLNHPYCHATGVDPILPNRVVEVGLQGRRVSLFGPKEHKVALLETHGQTGKYIALSHSWGSSPRLTATKTTLKDLKKGIAVHLLPKTFQDAVQITRRLGIRYLWIDCLCIIQDDPKDWEKESSEMARIYRNSHLTISASASSDSHSGCFPVRRADSYISSPTRSLGYQTPRQATGANTHTATYRNPRQPGKHTSVHLFEEWLPGSKSHAPQRMGIGSFGDSFDPIATEPLSSRGWTLQERLLSPRTVHYATDQIYFECETKMLSEDGFEFKTDRFSTKNCIGTQRIPFEEHGLRKDGGVSFIRGVGTEGKGPRWEYGWLGLVENYSRRRLTVANDKLPAMGGIARLIAEETGGDYLAGLWADHLPEDLYWRVDVQREGFQTPDNNDSSQAEAKAPSKVVRPAEYRAPTWSWASVDAPVKFNPLSYRNLVCRLRRCFTQQSGVDRFGRVRDGILEIDGPIYELKPKHSRKPQSGDGINVTVNLGDEHGEWNALVHLDYPEGPLQFPCYGLFLDPANAIVIRSRHLEPYKDEQGKTQPHRLVPKRVFGTCDVAPHMRKTPGGGATVWLPGDPNSEDPTRRQQRTLQIHEEEFQELVKWGHPRVDEGNHVVRVGIVILKYKIGTDGDGGSDEDEKDRKPVKQYDRERDGPLKWLDVQKVSGDESWGPLTKDDAKVAVTIF